VYSEPGQGTTFKVYLPRSDREIPLPEISPSVAAPVKRASETVLVIESEASVRRLSGRILSQAGYRVLEAATGIEAERALAQDPGSIDLVVTDGAVLGNGGLELFNRLQARAPGLRVLYMSGHPGEAAVREAGIDSGLPFVQKPFTPAELVRQVREALDR
jgi:DNA-binding NtrC family response regulator